MILYYGSMEIVDKPEIRKSNRTLDYGAGFYLTSSYEQAVKWVMNKLKGNFRKGFVNIYDYPPALEAGLNVLDFPNASGDWIDFVMANRMDKDTTT